jgi:hypothetical protein
MVTLVDMKDCDDKLDMDFFQLSVGLASSHSMGFN